MKDPQDPYPRTAKIVTSVIGDVETARQMRLLMVFCPLGAAIIGVGVVALLPAHVVVALLLVATVLTVWLLRVVIAYT